MKIVNSERLIALRKEYDDNHSKFNQQVYVSRYSEASRILKLIRVIKVKKPLGQTFHMLLTMLAHDMNANLTYDDLENDAFYRAGTKDKKREMHLACFNENEEVTLEWFTSEAWISKNFCFLSKKNGQETKIIYLEIVKSLKAKTGYLEQIMRNNYLKAEVIRFDMQMYELKRNLDLLSPKQLANYEIKMSKYKERLATIWLFSK